MRTAVCTLTEAVGLGELTETYDSASGDSCGGVPPNENLPGVLGGSEVGDKVDGLVPGGLCRRKITRTTVRLRINKYTYAR